jgi:predicted Zn-dependent protease
MKPASPGVAVLALLALAACQQPATSPTLAIAAAEATRPASAGPPIAMPSLAPDGGAIAHLKPAERPPISSDEAGLWLLSDKYEDQLRTSGSMVRDPALNDYAKGVVCRLAGAYCGDIRVYLVRRPGMNASMVPNGTMAVWTGLLLRARNEAQLATILAHEIGHYLRRHGMQAMRDARDKSAAALFFSVGFGVVGVPAAGDLVALGLVGSMYAFSRDNEREADDIGIRIMARAGYDPREAAKVWANLIAEVKNDEESKDRAIFFATHPEREERLETLAALAESLLPAVAEPRLGRAEHEAAIGPHRLGFLIDELQHRRYARLEPLLGMLAADGFRTGEVRYAEGEMYRLRGKEGDDAKALAAYEAAEVSGGAPAELYRSAGLVRLRQGDRAKAVSAFARYLELLPDATDREMIRMMMAQPTS